MTNLERVFQRFYCVLGLLALAIGNAHFYSAPTLLPWEDRLGLWFLSGLFVVGAAFVGLFWTLTEMPPAPDAPSRGTPR